MRRTAAVVIVLFMISVLPMAIAQEFETDTTTSASAAQQEEGATEVGKLKSRMHKAKDWDKMSLMKSMMQKQIVATSDGGVVVLSGNKLYKYDKNLNLKKEVQIPMDIEGKHSMIMEMMKKCPMKKKMQESDEEITEEMQEESQE